MISVFRNDGVAFCSAIFAGSFWDRFTPLFIRAEPRRYTRNSFMRDSEFEFIRSLVYEHSRINLTPDKRELVSARLGQRLRAHGFESLTDYCRLLQSPDSADELENLIDVISTNHRS